MSKVLASLQKSRQQGTLASPCGNETPVFSAVGTKYNIHVTLCMVRECVIPPIFDPSFYILSLHTDNLLQWQILAKVYL